MTKENISVKFLIHLVGERPALWDKTSDDYKDRALKETSWREICTFINENYERMPPKAKTEFTRMIMRKWTHIRDSWVKSMKYGYDEVTKKPPKPYIYHNELKFMQKILKCKPPRFDFNRPEISNMNFEEYFREKNETQYSNNNVSNGSETNKDEDEEEQDDETAEDVKQETNINESEHLIENHAEDIDEVAEDDWPLEDNEVANMIDVQMNEENNKPPVKKTRTSIFKTSRDEQEYRKPVAYEKSKEYEKPKEYQKPSENTKTPQFVKSSSSVMNSNTYLHENRHWNFFKGILPSVETLDEDHILQFQSGVIMLLQKLRESQKNKPKPNSNSNRVHSHSLYRGRGRKRKASNDDDYYWPIQNVEVVENCTRRSARHRSDPIAAEDMASESEYCSEN